MRSALFLVPLSAVALAACAPDLGAPPALRTPASLASARALPPGAGAWPDDRWWQGFGDVQLATLIGEALALSPDVAAAAARIRAADALAEQAGAALGPTGSIEGFAGGNQQSRNLGIPPQFVPRGVNDTGRITGSFGFDLDLWGRNRAALAAATSDAQAARVDFAQARLMLTAALAAAYVDLGAEFAARDVAAGALDVRSRTAALTAQRVAKGLESQAAAAQADARTAAARADLAAADAAILLTRHRLAALAGQGPDRGLAIARPALRSPAPGLPRDAGIDLVGRRPDVVAARLRSEAAASRIKVAHADFYPDLNLSAIIGLQSLGLGKLFENGSRYGTAGAALSLPLFDRGRIAGRYRGARAAYDEAVAAYDSTLLAALRETADALASRAAADSRLTDQRRALAAAREAARLAQLRYAAGLSNQLPVLVAEDSVLAAERAVTELEALRLAQDIALIRALGGGFAGSHGGDADER